MAQVERTVTLRAAAERVWDAVLRGDWLGDEGAIEPRAGADGWVRDGDVLRHLVVEVVEDGRVLTFRWWPLGPDGVGPASRVTIALESDDADDADEQTRVVVVEAPLAGDGMVPDAGPMAMAMASRV